MEKVIYNGTLIDFKELFYPYIDMREGYRNVVYPDIYGNPTYGIGHKVEEWETVKIGDTVTNEQIFAAYELDYADLKIEPWIAEIQAAGHSYNMMLAVASFLWAHGYGDYQTSRLRSGLLANTFTADSVQTYLQANWDIRKPKNQIRNRKDFEVGFDTTPWQAPFFLPRQNGSASSILS